MFIVIRIIFRLMLSIEVVWSTILGFRALCGHTWIPSNLRFHRGLSATYCPQLPCLSDPESMPDANYVDTMRSISSLNYILYQQCTVYTHVYTEPNEITTYSTGVQNIYLTNTQKESL